MPATTSRMKTGDREPLPPELAFLEGYNTHLLRLFRERTTFVGLFPGSVERNDMHDVPCSHERLGRVVLDELGMSRFSSPEALATRFGRTGSRQLRKKKLANHSAGFCRLIAASPP